MLLTASGNRQNQPIFKFDSNEDVELTVAYIISLLKVTFPGADVQ